MAAFASSAAKKFFSAQNPTFQQTMLRVKDPKVSVKFYTENFGMKLINEYHFGENQGNFSLYFLTSLKEGEPGPMGGVGSKEAHDYIWNCRKGQSFLELTHNHGTEDQEGDLTDHALRKQVYHNGNSDPRGFGHIAFDTDDVYAASEKLIAKGVPFKKKPNEGRMKGLAFALDPDGYWVEIVKRSVAGVYKEEYNLSQTMIRIKDPKVSLPFYRDVFGMKVLKEKHFSDFSLFFLATNENEDSSSPWDPLLELTHNHGTENEPGPSYHNGCSTTFKGEKCPRGFGHIGFLVDNLKETCEKMEEYGVEFYKRPHEGSMKSIAFAKDPGDEYWIEIVQRGQPMFNQ